MKVTVLKTAERQINKLDRQIRMQIFTFLERISNYNDPRQDGKPLQGKSHGLWSYRHGDYRLIAEIDDKAKTIIISYMGNRKEVYKHLEHER